MHGSLFKGFIINIVDGKDIVDYQITQWWPCFFGHTYMYLLGCIMHDNWPHVMCRTCSELKLKSATFSFPSIWCLTMSIHHWRAANSNNNACKDCTMLKCYMIISMMFSVSESMMVEQYPGCIHVHVFLVYVIMLVVLVMVSTLVHSL